MLQVNYRKGCPLAQAIVDGLGGVLFQYPFKCAMITALSVVVCYYLCVVVHWHVQHTLTTETFGPI